MHVNFRVCGNGNNPAAKAKLTEVRARVLCNVLSFCKDLSVVRVEWMLNDIQRDISGHQSGVSRQTLTLLNFKVFLRSTVKFP